MIAMEIAEGEALADAAYGLLEIRLNTALRERGTHLFWLVEHQQDFKTEFKMIFSEFAKEYPQLAGSLLQRFGSIETIYEMIRNGEGVIPSKTTQMYWIVQDAPGFRPDEADDEKMGKWLVFLAEEDVDDIWRKIRNATAEGLLGISAKVSTHKPNPESRDERKVIYVYTTNWDDEADVMRVREKLRELGIDQRIGYKRNIETYQGEYSQKGKKVTFYSA
jgi:hypothetical protein